MFRQGSKNGHAVYWSDPDEPGDRFVCTAMTPAAASGLVVLLNMVGGLLGPDFLASLPTVPKRDPAP